MGLRRFIGDGVTAEYKGCGYDVRGVWLWRDRGVVTVREGRVYGGV